MWRRANCFGRPRSGRWRRREVFVAGKIDYLLGDDEYLVHLFAMEAREKLPFWRYDKGKDAFLFSPEEALEKATFPDTREVLEKVLARLDSGASGSPCGLLES